METSGIYKIRSISHPDRCYIGSSQRIESRIKLHFRELIKGRHHSIKLQYHYNKYGESDLVVSILTECEKSILLRKEQCYLNIYTPYFNILKIAGSHLGAKRSPASCERIRNANRGEKHWLYGKHTPEVTKAKLRLASLGNQYSKGIKQSEETKRKRAEKLKGHPNYLLKHSEEAKEKIRQANSGENGYWFGKHLSDETKKKIGLKNKGHHYGFQKGNKIALGKKMSDETKKKLSEAKKGKPTWSKGKHQKPEAIEKSRIKRTGARRTDEMKKRISDACKIGWTKKKIA